MTKRFLLFSLCTAAMIVMTSGLHTDAVSQANPCIDCHSKETPHVVEQWKKSKHSMNEVVCQICHLAGSWDQNGFDHNGFRITRDITVLYCEDCHALANEEMKASRDKHGNFSHAPLK